MYTYIKSYLILQCTGKPVLKNKEGEEEVMLSLKSVELSICISWHKQPSDIDLFAGTSLKSLHGWMEEVVVVLVLGFLHHHIKSHSLRDTILEKCVLIF